MHVFSCFVVCLFVEPHGGEHGVVPHHHQLQVVPPLLRHAVPQQDRPAGGQDHVLSPGRLLPRVRR